MKNVIIDMTVDAFVFNPAVCAGPDCRIAPITQPNYDNLSLQQEKVQADVFKPHDLQYSLPAETNSRLIDIGTGKIRKNRLGVYVHWVLPTTYRTGDFQQEGGIHNQYGAQEAVATPKDKPVPNRWLVIRTIRENTMRPADAPVPEAEGWIVESDRLRDVSELPDGLDTQIDVSPYISRNEQGKTRQGRDFIGYKTSALHWTEDPDAKRVDLSIMSSSNQLFADYQPHNGNVFSICDNFSYKVGEETKYLESCDASYLIFGWHSDDEKDPFYSPSPEKMTFHKLLRRNHIHLIEGESIKSLSATASGGSLSSEGTIEFDSTSRTLLWGTIHNVKWSVQNKPTVSPADEAAALFKNPHKLPIAVGTGPLDALFTYVKNHHGEGVADLILKLQTLLIEQEDGVPEQDAAQDLLRNTDYDRLDGGMSWHLSGKKEPSTTVSIDDTKNVLPSDAALIALRAANAIQAKLDTLRRTLPALRWELFSHWWKFLCDRGHDRDINSIKEEVSRLSTRLDKLLAEEGSQSVYHTLPQLIEKALAEVKLPCEPAAAERFHQHQDPTLLIAGLQSGWPRDHVEETKAHLGVELKEEHFDMPASVGSIGSDGTITHMQSTRKLTEELIKVVPVRPETAALTNAFLNFKVTATDDQPVVLTNQPVWTKQPWCPLFLEWEVEYYHIPYEHWKMDRYEANNSNTMQHIRWGIKTTTDVSKIPGVRENMRKVDGRVLLLPQPGFSLGSKVEQLFTNVPTEILDKFVSLEERTQLVDRLKNSFPYMSSPLSGFTDHLLTLQQGTHINPNQRIPERDNTESESAKPTEDAIELTKDKIGLGEDQLLQVGDETGATPYAIQVSGLPKQNGAFKPATHGQFRFTKINIIDKFGQAISVIDQSPAQHSPPIYPCVSELYTLQRLESGMPNAVITDNNTPDGAYEFLQIPTRINQPARLNAHFMVEDPTDGWRVTDDWDNPIFGWLLINFANYGLQVFLPGGQFYREIRLGGASGATASKPWLPFPPPSLPLKDNLELDKFLDKMQDETYLKSVYKMILDASNDIQESPDSYAEFLSALVGKPIALTNVGFSLELDTAEKKDQVVYPTENGLVAEDSVLTYELPLKIGDGKRLYDGLVGYFEPGHPEKIYTYHSGLANGPTVPINVNNYPTLSPFFIDPNDTPPQDYIKMRNGKLRRMVALLDPFVALHGYTALLPIVDIKLPDWAVETAMKKMTAFFHLGPVMATKDVPVFDVEYKLKDSYKGDVKPYPGKGLAIPAGLKKEDWVWLQPYATGDNEDVLEFMPLNVDAAEEKLRWEPAPYTAVEGYIQLKRAIGGKPPPPDGNKQAPGERDQAQGWTGVGTGWIH